MKPPTRSAALEAARACVRAGVCVDAVTVGALLAWLDDLRAAEPDPPHVETDEGLHLDWHRPDRGVAGMPGGKR